MKKEDFLKLMDGIDDRLVEKYAISDEAEARQKQIRSVLYVQTIK